jgi:SPP1 gp7 family putative phage head morphogenesis protein
LFGILENSNRSTIDAAYYLYTKNVLRKELKFIDDVLNIQLIPELDNTVTFVHDNVVPEDGEFELKKASEGLKNGGILVDEWRQAKGWEPLPNDLGQILYTPLNMMPTKLTGETIVQDTTQPPENEMPVQPEKSMVKTFQPEQKNRIWEILDKAAVKNEHPFINNLKRYFQSQQDRIINNMTKGVKAEGEEMPDIDDLLEWKEEDGKLLATLKSLWVASLKEGYEAANETFGLGVSFDVMNPKFLDWVSKYGATKVKEINDTTKEKLQKTLTEGISDGEGIPKLKNRVLEVMGEAKTSRATLIARTETHNTVSSGTFDTYAAAGVKKTSWLTSMDGRERESHAAINGEIREIGDAFSNGLLHTGDPSGPAEEVCRCRCTSLPELD